LSYELDLRTPRCKASTRLIKPGAYKYVFLALAAFILSAAYCGMELYASKLEEEIRQLSLQLSASEPAYEEMSALKSATELTRRRASLEENLRTRRVCPITCLQNFRSAAPAGLVINEASIGGSDLAEIRGSGPSMQATAFFKQNLKALPFTKNVRLENITLRPDGRYSYYIRADLALREGDVFDENN